MFEGLGSLRSAEVQLSYKHWFFLFCVCKQSTLGPSFLVGQFVGCSTDGFLAFLMSCPCPPGSGGAQHICGLQLQGFSESPKSSFCPAFNSMVHFLPLVFCSASGMFWTSLESCLASGRREALAVWGHTNSCSVSGAITNLLIWECT